MRVLRAGHYWLAHLFGALVILQFAFAGYGAFKIQSDQRWSKAAYDLHGLNGGLIMPVVALLMLAFALAGRLVGLRKLTALLVVLMIVQTLLAGFGVGDDKNPGSGYPVIGALHPVNGIAILLVTALLIRRARETDSAGSEPSTQPA